MDSIISVDHLTKRLHPAWLDLGVTVALFIVFTIVGTYLFVRSDRNR